MDSIYTVASTNSSVAYGNVAQHVKEFVKTLFPKNYFTYEHISSEIAYRHIRKRLGANTRQQLDVRKKPYMILRPIVSVPDDMYLYGTPLTSNFDHLHNALNTKTMIPIIRDTDEGIGLSFKLNRDKIEFQVTVVVASLMQQIDIYKGLANIAFWNRPFSKTLPMEYMIPRGIIGVMASRQHMDITNEVYAANIFMDYINKHSRYPITYKMRNSTSHDEYFMYSTQDIILTLEDLQLSEGTMTNMATDNFEISFRVTAEFNLPGLFVLYGNDALKESTLNETVVGIVENDGLSFPLFTLENLFSEAELDNGFKKFKSSILEMEPDQKTKDDTTDFGVLLGDGFKKVIQNYVGNNIDINTISILQLYKNGILLTKGVDYDVDWSRTTLVTHNPSTEDTYRMIIYVNTIKLNEMLVDYQNQIVTDKPGLINNTNK